MATDTPNLPTVDTSNPTTVDTPDPTTVDTLKPFPITTIQPTIYGILPVLTLTVIEIQPGERFQITVPKEYSHHENGTINWHNIEEIQMNYRGSLLRPNVFVTLRFDQNDEQSEFIVDIGCLAE